MNQRAFLFASEKRLRLGLLRQAVMMSSQLNGLLLSLLCHFILIPTKPEHSNCLNPVNCIYCYCKMKLSCKQANCNFQADVEVIAAIYCLHKVNPLRQALNDNNDTLNRLLKN